MKTQVEFKIFNLEVDQHKKTARFLELNRKCMACETFLSGKSDHYASNIYYFVSI